MLSHNEIIKFAREILLLGIPLKTLNWPLMMIAHQNLTNKKE